MSHKPSRILLVDDDVLLRMLLGAYLMADGYEVLEADSIPDARHMLLDHEATFDSMILDRNLGDEDGLTLAIEMRDSAAWKHIPIVMLTGCDKPEQVQEGLAAGVFYYLTKPVSQQVLNWVIGLACEQAPTYRHEKSIAAIGFPGRESPLTW